VLFEKIEISLGGFVMDDPPLKIRRPIYESLPKIYRAIADELSKQHKVIIVDEIEET